jgi:hypothetical protein
MAVGENVDCHHTLQEMVEDHAGAKTVDHEIQESRRHELVYIRCFAHDLPERDPPLFDPAYIARSHSSRQSLRQYPRQRNPIMLAPQSGQIRLRIAEIKLELVFVSRANEAIMSLPVVAVLHRRMHRTFSADRRSVLGSAHWIRAAAPGVRYRYEEQLSRQTCYPVNVKEIG